ncbi:hypothetical protein NKI32_07810 [Mesorhizobium sp. M0761]|uniref:hypothetical protein n=1 Tax=Mesorhizobium sp. M0761 TaxID=2956994 RepID=UPI0033385309
MTAAKPEQKIGESRAYWTHKVDAFPSPVAQFRMAQLIDLDNRLYETARIVYRFLVGWYHDEHGDALLSQRHVAKAMKQRAPEGATVPSRNAVQRAIIALMDTGWVVRTFQGRGKGKGASRYVPVVNVLDLAAQGRFPELAHANGPVDIQDEPAHANGPPVAHATGPVDAEPAHATGPKTLLPDPLRDAGKVGRVSTAPSAPPAACLSAATAGTVGFEKVWLAYGKLGNKTSAREAFAVIVNPNVEHIAARAASWAASAKPGTKRLPLQKWLAAEKYDEADRMVTPAVKMPTKRKGAFRRDAMIEGLGDARIMLRWNDARSDEKPTYEMFLGSRQEDVMRDLGIDDIADLAGRRVLIDFWDGDDGEEFEKWHRYPDQEIKQAA